MERNELIEAAKAARERAYAPYSRFGRRGAAGARRDDLSRLQRRERVLRTLQLCGTHGAVFGHRRRLSSGDFTRLAVVGDTDGPIAPCGACRQVIIEIGTPDIEVILPTLKGAVEVTTAHALLPGAFRL